MLSFSASQVTFDIGGVRVGGQPGAIPTVLIGSIFYKGHKIVTNAKQGKFNKKRARQLIEFQDQISQKTGNPCMLDVVGDTSEAIKRFIDFVAESTTSPILIDSTSAATRIEAIRYCAEIGLLNRVVYNSLMPSYQSEELEAIRDVKLQQALLLAFSKQLASTVGRIDTITNGAGSGLLLVAKKAGITKPIVDTCFIPLALLAFAKTHPLFWIAKLRFSFLSRGYSFCACLYIIGFACTP